MTIQAIETKYNGYRFRSRLEARWAVFFDAIGVRWEYEKEGFELPSGRYLPDFWLSDQKCWIEIKGQEPSVAETRLAQDLAMYSRSIVYLFFGDIPDPMDIRGHIHNGESAYYFPGADNWVLFDKPNGFEQLYYSQLSSNTGIELIELDRRFSEIQDSIGLSGSKVYLTEKHLRGHLSTPAYNEFMDQFRKLDLRECKIYALSKGDYGYDYPYAWTQCPDCGQLGLGFSGWSERVCDCKGAYKNGCDSPLLVRGYEAARSARFEHGETPKVPRGKPRK